MAEELGKGAQDPARLQKEMEARRQEMVKSVEKSHERLKGLLGPQRPPGKEEEAKSDKS